VGAALGQYSGTYTIMPSGGDFASHAEAADSLMTYGVVGPCTLLMYTGTYYGQAYFDNADWDSVEVMFKASPGESVSVEYSSYPWHIHYTDNITVDGVRTVSTESHGAYVHYSNKAKFSSCDIAADAHGLYLTRSDSCKLLGNSISADDHGILLDDSDSDGCDWCVVADNSIASYYGISLHYYSDHCSIVGNRFQGSGYYAVYMCGDSGDPNTGNVFVNNMFAGTGYGMFLHHHDSTRLVYNSLCGQYYGFRDHCGYHETMYNNIFWGQDRYGWFKDRGNAYPVASDYNCFYGNYNAIYHTSFGAISVAEWRAYSRMDNNSIEHDPLTRSPADLHLKTASPCRDSGVSVPDIPKDIDGDTRDSDPCIGCDEWRDPGPPVSGVFYIHPNPDSGDYVSFLEAWGAICARGFGGDITLRAFSGTYEGDLDLHHVGNDTFTFTMEAVEGQTPVIQGTGGSTPAVSMTSARNVTIQGLTLNGYYGLRMYSYYGTEGCANCSIIGNYINGSYYGTYIYRGCDNVIAGNVITTSGCYGLYWCGHPSGRTHDNHIYNNMIVSTFLYGYGSYFYYHDRLHFLYNSMLGRWYYGLQLGYSDNCQLRNNVVCNTIDSPYYPVAWLHGYDSLTSDYNCWWPGDSLSPVINGMTLEEWQELSGQDSNSIVADPRFVSETDLHLQVRSPCRDAALATVDVPYDIDGDARDSCPDIGADEFTGVGAPMSGTFYIHPDPDSGDYVSFLEALADLSFYGFGGDVTFLAYSGLYPGEIDLSGLENGSYKLTLAAVPGARPVLTTTTSYGIRMIGSRHVRVEGLTINGYYAIYMYYAGDQGCEDCEIKGNWVNGEYTGIYLYGRARNNLFEGNYITSAGYYCVYSYSDSAPCMRGNRFYNNMITSTSNSGYGLYFLRHDSLQLLYNSMYGSWFYSVLLGYSPNCRIKNNAVYNRTPYIYYGNVNLYGNAALESDYNCWWTEDTANPRRVFYPFTLQMWRDSTGLDSNSIAADPMFVSVADLHLQAGSPCIDSGLAMAEVPYDIDGELRDSTPCIGADEWVGTGMAEGMGRPLVVDLFRPAPNPASGPVRIRWQVPCLSRVSLKAYDISGRCVNTLVDGMVETGVYVTVWHGRDDSGRRLAPGIYFCTFEAKDKKLTHKVVLTGVR
ncbi:MAG: right-handed parallel beta-helix repeat-containing protein, partial [candidate division WOR-3 bacterium]